MKGATRRQFLKSSLAAVGACQLPALALAGVGPSKAAGPNAQVRIAVVGLGGINTVGGVGGRGRQLIDRLRTIPTAKIVALCDIDQAILDHEVGKFKDRHENVTVYHDMRQVFDDKNVDAVMLAIPNHWHALGTIWACQAGKDVYVEKPFSYNIWEGQQAVAAARKYGRLVQVGTQSRSSSSLHQAFDYLRSGQLGAIRFAHAILYRGRQGIGKVDGPMPVPATLNYDTWCGPAPKGPLMRKQLHYDWHWVWATGNGEMGNNGAHCVDVCRWALGQNQPAPRAMSIGGRFGFNDDGETANTQIAIWDYQPAPIICEIRNLSVAKGEKPLGVFRNVTSNNVIDCEGGYYTGNSTGGAIFDHHDKKIKDLGDKLKPQDIEVSHVANFVAAVASRKAGDLHAEAQVGHVSAACLHMANISHRLGKQAPPEAIQDAIRPGAELSDSFQRCREYLRANGVDLGATPAVLGPWVSFDAQKECFVNEFAEQANALCHRDYRAPFTVPKIV